MNVIIKLIFNSGELWLPQMRLGNNALHLLHPLRFAYPHTKVDGQRLSGQGIKRDFFLHWCQNVPQILHTHAASPFVQKGQCRPLFKISRNTANVRGLVYQASRHQVNKKVILLSTLPCRNDNGRGGGGGRTMAQGVVAQEEGVMAQRGQGVDE